MARNVEKSISGVFSQCDTPYIAHVNHDKSYHSKHAQHTEHRTKNISNINHYDIIVSVKHI